MYLGKFVFAQVMDHLPLHTFHRCVARYSGEHKVKRFSCLDQYLCMAFAQLTYRESPAILKRACVRKAASSITWGFAAALHATHSPMPMRRGIGAPIAPLRKV